jgi:hypothetical protein
MPSAPTWPDYPARPPFPPRFLASPDPFISPPELETREGELPEMETRVAPASSGGGVGTVMVG